MITTPAVQSVALVRIGAWLGLVAVACGAFGTHELRTRFSEEMLRVWQTGVQYQLVHAPVVCLLGWIVATRPSKTLAVAGWLIGGGVAIFSGSLYLLALTSTRLWGAVTPIGGLLMIGGWLIIALTVKSPTALNQSGKS